MAFKRGGQQRVSKILSRPAYTKGINDYDPVAMMESEYALFMQNFFPNTRAITCRRGYRQYATGLGLPPQTLMTYRAQDGSEQFFAATDSGIYDISISTTIPQKVVDTITNGYFSYTHFANAAGTWLVAVNGTDMPLLYDGTTWTQMTFVAPTTQIGEVEGVDPSTFSYVLSFKNRLWFVQKNSTVLWYLPTDQLGGVAKPFYVGAILDRGGYVSMIWDWTFGDSSALNDRLAVISSTGQVAVYKGTDPDNAETWGIDGLFFVSAPLGPRSVTPIGGDLAMLTMGGVLPLSKAATEERSTLLDNAFSKYINKTLNRFLTTLYPQQKWGIANIPNLQALVVVVPDVERPLQFVMNLITGAWTTYNLPIVTIGLYKGTLYFSDQKGDINVYGTTFLDGEDINGEGGVPVQCSVFGAFDYMDNPTANKHYKLIRPIIQASTAPSMAWKINTDFDILPLAGNPANPGPSGQQYLWDKAFWDEAFWSSETTVVRNWYGVSGVGICAALLLKIASVAETGVVAIEWVFEEGNSL